MQAAATLNALGVQPGERVAIMLPNTPAFVVWYYGALRMGAIAVSISTRLADSELDFIVGDAGCKVLVADEQKSAGLQQSLKADLHHIATNKLGDLFPSSNAPPDNEEVFDANPNDAALILYTSGTTGFAKGATLSHLNVRSNVCAFNHLCDQRPDDRILLAVPLFHCFGQNALLNSAFYVGSTLVLQEKFDLNETKRLIETQQITQLYGVPMMFQLLHDSCSTEDLASVNYCFCAAATLPIQTANNWRAKYGLPIHEGYGLTETSPFASYNHRDHFKPGSIGTPIDNVEFKIVDTESGEPCEVGELGEIAIRGPNVMLGYWNRPDDTAAAIKDGWFHSGDIGRVDENGYYYIVDRVKDMIAVGGMKVFPAEVERVLLDHPFVKQAAVIGVPDPVFGEQVVAYLTLDESQTTSHAIEKVSQHAKTNLGNFKIPRQFIPIDELPRNPSGKILKTKLREQFKEHSGNAHQIVDASNDIPEPRLKNDQPSKNIAEPILRPKLKSVHASEKLRTAIDFVSDLVQKICDTSEKPDAETRFLDAGLDSLMIVEMSHQIQAEVGAEKELPATLVFDCPRIVDLASYLVETIEPAEEGNAIARHGNTPPDDSMKDQIESMSEEQALAELMKELE